MTGWPETFTTGKCTVNHFDFQMFCLRKCFPVISELPLTSCAVVRHDPPPHTHSTLQQANTIHSEGIIPTSLVSRFVRWVFRVTHDTVVHIHAFFGGRAEKQHSDRLFSVPNCWCYALTQRAAGSPTSSTAFPPGVMLLFSLGTVLARHASNDAVS